MRCYNVWMLWIAAQAFVTIAITVAFAKIVKASLRTSIGLGMFYAGYEMALVGVITGHIESCHVGMFVVLCGTILFLAKLVLSMTNHAPISLPEIEPLGCKGPHSCRIEGFAMSRVGLGVGERSGQSSDVDDGPTTATSSAR